jgi:hypothetical protein
MHILAFLAGHATNYARREKSRNTTYVGCGKMHKSRAEQDWTCPVLSPMQLDKQPFDQKQAFGNAYAVVRAGGNVGQKVNAGYFSSAGAALLEIGTQAWAAAQNLVGG